MSSLSVPQNDVLTYKLLSKTLLKDFCLLLVEKYRVEQDLHSAKLSYYFTSEILTYCEIVRFSLMKILIYSLLFRVTSSVLVTA